MSLRSRVDVTGRTMSACRAVAVHQISWTMTERGLRTHGRGGRCPDGGGRGSRRPSTRARHRDRSGFTVEFVALTGSEQKVAEFAPPGSTSESGCCPPAARGSGSCGGDAHAALVRVAEPETSAGQADLTEHRGESDRRPVRLLAVILSLEGPGAGDEGSARRHARCELSNDRRANAGDPLRPFRRLRLPSPWPSRYRSNSS